MAFNFHTHCHFCDGKGKAEDFLQEAVNQKFTAFGFSSHAPTLFENNFSIKEEDLAAYVQEIENAKKKYPQLPTSIGLECDYIPKKTRPFAYFKKQHAIQYIIGGIHLVGKEDALWFIDGSKSETYDKGLYELFDGNIREAVKSYFFQLFEMIENEDFEILAHFDKIKMHNKGRFFSEDEKWYQDFLLETICLAKEKKLIVEVNTRGLYKGRFPDFYPSVWVLKKCKEANIPLTISSDAHQPTEISLEFERAKRTLKLLGFKDLSILKEGKIVQIPF